MNGSGVKDEYVSFYSEGRVQHYGTAIKEALVPRTLINATLSVLIAMALASCGEKAPRPHPEGHRSYSNATPQHPAYERTLNQGESQRMGE